MIVYGVIVMGRFALGVHAVHQKNEARMNSQYLIPYYSTEVKFYP